MSKLTRIQQAEMLEQMAAIYPGDPDGALTREACKLRGIPYEPPEVIITYEDDDAALKDVDHV